MSKQRLVQAMATALLATVPVIAGAQVDGTGPAAADAGIVTPAERLDDVIVTAQRRPEPLQTVPIAVTAFSTDQLAVRNITAPLGLLQYVPNALAVNTPGFGSANTHYIRGLGSSETIATVDPAVGTYLDGIYLSRQNANNFGFFDVERVEVLRGPQGTLFGRNTNGGAIDVVLRQPGDAIAGYLEAGYGSYRKTSVRGSIDLPVSQLLSVKLSGYYQNDRGYARNTTTGERNNDADGAGLRGAVRLQLNEQLSWNAAVAYLRSDGDNLLNFECGTGAPDGCGDRFLTTGLRKSYVGINPSPFAAAGVSGRKAAFGLGNETDTVLTTSNIEWRGENHTLSLITGVVGLKQKYAIDFTDGRGLPTVANPLPAATGGALGGFVTLSDGDHDQFTQEVRLSGRLVGGFLDYVAGAYFYDEDNTTDFADLSGAAVLADRTIRNSTEAIAGYVQVDANLGERVKLTGGVRYTDEDKRLRVGDNRAGCRATPVPATCLDTANLAAGGTAIATRRTTRIWTPRFAISYQLPQALVFASATRGYRSGGWNGRATTSDALLPFAPEKTWSYEGGVRSELFDRRLRVNLTGFYADSSDVQTSSASIDPVSGAPRFFAGNVADYRNYGVELEIATVPVRGLSVYGSVGYQNDKYQVSDAVAPSAFGVKAVRQQQADCRAQLAAGRVPLAPAGAGNAADCAAGIVDADGNIADPVRTPDFSVAVGGLYEYPIPAAGIILQPSVNAVYRGSFETGSANASLYEGGGTLIGGSRTSSFVEVNGALALRTDDGNWILAVECSNCLDETYSQSSLFNYSYLNAPRTWRVRAKRSF